MSESAPAEVIASHGRQSLIETPDGRLLAAVARGRRRDVHVGDWVGFSESGPGQAVIDSVRARRNEFRRSDAWRSKTLAVNLDQIAVVIAPSPPFSEELLLRVLVCAETAGIGATLIANKADLAIGDEAFASRIEVYRRLNYPVLKVTASQPEPTWRTLHPVLAGRRTLLVGQSGMGKSTLVNALIPQAEQATREISTALDSGRHTTTFTRSFPVSPAYGNSDPDSGHPARLIDSPGFQTFGLSHVSPSQLAHSMREFAPYLGRCRFSNCQHDDEPACAIGQAINEGRIDSRRWQLYRRLLPETREPGR